MFQHHTVAPKIAPFDFGDQSLNVGETASVQCLILGGDLPMVVQWLLNHNALDTMPGVSLSKIGKRVNVLTIESISYKHAGNYTCQAKNVAGSSAISAQLIVNGLFVFVFCLLVTTKILYAKFCDCSVCPLHFIVFYSVQSFQAL